MRRMLNWLKSWWGLGRVSRQLSALDRRLDQLEQEKKRLETSREDHYESLLILDGEIGAMVSEAKEDLEKADALVKRYEVELEAARTQIQIYEELTVPTMTSQFKTVMETADALTAEQVRRRVAASLTQEGIE